MPENPFEKTLLNNLRQSLPDAYGVEKGTAVFEEACRGLSAELEQVSDTYSKAEAKILKQRILPGYSCYKALLKFGIPSNEAISFIEKEICETFRRNLKMTAAMKHLPFMFGLLGILLKRMVKQYDSINPGTYYWDEKSKNRIAFHCTKCFYYDELLKRNVPELCAAFCATDAVAAEPLLPKVVFKRTGTLVNCDSCDFCYEKVKKAGSTK
jgi:hypothetical protein